MRSSLHFVNRHSNSNGLSLWAWQARAESLLSSVLAGTFWQNPIGSDLWIDGLKSVGTFATADLDVRRNAPFVDAAEPLVSGLDLERPAKCLADLRAAILAAGSDVEFSSKMLGLGLTILAASGLVPRLWHPELSVANDSLLLLLSPIYRWLRFEAYNRGAYFGRPLPGDGSFQPAIGRFHLPDHKVTKGTPRRIPSFSVSHELAHFLLFGPLYAGREEPNSDAEALFAAELKCISIEHGSQSHRNLLSRGFEEASTKTVWTLD